MLTYKVLLVDDEEEVMDVIEHRICWKQMGFEVVGKAQNGVKALEISEKMQRWAEKACETAGVTTYARVDELLNEDGDIYCLEINTLPGMTGTSLLPQEAAAVGMSYDELTKKIIEISLEKYN